MDEDACLKQGKTRLTFIRIIVYPYSRLLSSPSSSSRSLAKKAVDGEQLPRFPRMLTSRLRFQCFNRDSEVPRPLLQHSTTRNHVDYPPYPAQLAQHWPEGSPHTLAHWFTRQALMSPRTSATRCRYALPDHDRQPKKPLLTLDSAI